jgi:hypothetical protein
MLETAGRKDKGKDVPLLTASEILRKSQLSLPLGFLPPRRQNFT